MKPTIGRDVHYVAYGTPNGEFEAGAHRTAKVTEVLASGGLNLFVIHPTGFQFVFGVMEDSEGTQPGSWHWPERED